MLKHGLGLLILFVMVGFSTQCFAAESCGTLLKRCDQCHDKERICENVGRNLKYWKGTIKYMVSNGAEISKDQNETLSTCLSSKSDEALKFCK